MAFAIAKAKSTMNVEFVADQEFVMVFAIAKEILTVVAAVVNFAMTVNMSTFLKLALTATILSFTTTRVWPNVRSSVMQTMTVSHSSMVLAMEVQLTITNHAIVSYKAPRIIEAVPARK